MQTFLPHPSFVESARCLDRQRLGKQRVECLQLLRALLGLSKGWANHPAARMWRGCEMALAEYGIDVCVEWMARGYADSCWNKINSLVGLHLSHSIVVGGSTLPDGHPKKYDYPTWLGDPAFHAAHRSNLLRKDPEWYGQFEWTELPTLPYVWPVS